MQLTFEVVASIGICLAGTTVCGAHGFVRDWNTQGSGDALNPVCERNNAEARSLLHEGHPAEAATQLSEFLASLTQTPDNTLCSGVSLSNLGYAFRDLGKSGEAEQAARHSVESFESSVGVASPWLCRPLLLLVRLSLERGTIRQAEALLSRVESLPLSAHGDLALVIGLRAHFLEQSGDFRPAERAYREAIAEWEKAGEGDTPSVLPELSNLALLYGSYGDVRKALVLLERAWRIVDGSSVDTNTCFRVLLAFASTLTRQGDNKRTESYFQRAIALLDALPPGLRQVDGEAVYRAYQGFLKQKGRNREARMIERQALALFGPSASSSVVGIATLPREDANLTTRRKGRS